MKLLHLFKYSLFLGLFVPSMGMSQNIVDNILKEKNETKQIELALSIYKTHDAKVDTSTLKGTYKKFLQSDNEGLQLAYYLILADCYSIAYDNINKKSDLAFDDALQLAKTSKNKVYEFLVLVRRGGYNFTYRKIQSALVYNLTASRILNSISTNDIPLAAGHLQELANFYGYIGNHPKAIEYYKLASQLPLQKPRQKIDLINSVAVYYGKDKIYDKAMYYYDEALQIARTSKDSVWIGIILGNKGYIYRNKGENKKAIELVKENIKYSKKYDEKLDIMRTSIGLADLYAKEKNWSEAKKYAQDATLYMDDKPYFIQYKTDLNYVLAQIAEHEGNDRQFAKYLKSYVIYKDSLQNVEDKNSLQKIMWQWESERFENALKDIDKKQRDNILNYIIITCLIILVLGIIILLINKSRQQIKIHSIQLEKERLSLLIAKEKVDDELLTVKSTMEDFIKTIKQNETNIIQLEMELTNAYINQHENVEDIQNDLDNMLKSHIMTEERWVRFKSLFESMHPGYLEDQRRMNPKISDNNLKLLCLTKLDLSNQSIAHLLGISLEGVKKAKQRLRKKYEISLEESDSDY